MFLLLLNFRQNYKAAENIKKEKIENKDRERERENKKKKNQIFVAESFKRLEQN